MKNQSLPASENLQDIESDKEKSIRLSLDERLEHLIKDPSSAIEDIKELGKFIIDIIKGFSTRVKSTTHYRQLALAEARLEVRREALARQKATKLETEPVTPVVTPTPIENAPPEMAEDKGLESTNTPTTKAEQTQSQPETAVPKAATSQPTAPSTPAPVSEGDTSPALADSTQLSIAKLQAMEWDLRTCFDFGDLRAFEFCTGSQVIRFPDRTTHPEPAQPSYPTGFDRLNPPAGFVVRADEFVVLPHHLPPGFAPKAEGKSKTDARPKSTRKKAEPSFKDGGIDWQSFVRPLCTGIWPFNTLIPAPWQYGDPVPGGLGEENERKE